MKRKWTGKKNEDEWQNREKKNELSNLFIKMKTNKYTSAASRKNIYTINMDNKFNIWQLQMMFELHIYTWQYTVAKYSWGINNHWSIFPLPFLLHSQCNWKLNRITSLQIILPYSTKYMIALSCITCAFVVACEGGGVQYKMNGNEKQRIEIQSRLIWDYMTVGIN